MTNINVVAFGGNLTADPVLTKVGQNSVVRFTIAYNYIKTDPNDPTKKISIPCFCPCELWGKRSNVIANHCKKGTSIVVTGKLENSTWTNKKDGQARFRTQIHVQTFDFVRSKDE